MENKQVLMKSFMDSTGEKICEKVNEFSKVHEVIATQTLSHIGRIVAFVYYRN